MQKLNLRLFSNDAKKLADFYGEVFNREITPTREKANIIYECRVSQDSTITFTDCHDFNSKVGLKFTIRRDFKLIEEILTNWNIPYEKQTSAGKTSSLHAKDPDGNELCLLRKEIYVGMPIGN